MGFIVITYATLMFGMLFLIIQLILGGMSLKEMYGIVNYKLNRLLDKWLGGYISFFNITIYGRNAMRWAVNIKTKKYGYICFNLPIPVEGIVDKFYYYLSPDGTPNASTYWFGNKHNKRLAELRKFTFGHNFDTTLHRDDLYYINNYGTLPINYLREKTIESILND